MTMMKRENPSIWSFVREDRDIDDIIFADDNFHGEEYDMHSER